MYTTTGTTLSCRNLELAFVQINLLYIGCSSAQIHILTEFSMLAIETHNYL